MTPLGLELFRFLSTPSARRATAALPTRKEAQQFLSTPSARRATSLLVELAPVCEFLSTPSARRATGGRALRPLFRGISIHALREEGDGEQRAPVARSQISIHALREEGDPCPRGWLQSACAFLSTPSARRATRYFSKGIYTPCYFYPRPPRGGRPFPAATAISEINFYPRPPRGGRQQKQRQNLYFQTNYTTFCTNLEEP